MNYFFLMQLERINLFDNRVGRSRYSFCSSARLRNWGHHEYRLLQKQLDTEYFSILLTDSSDLCATLYGSDVRYCLRQTKFVKTCVHI